MIMKKIKNKVMDKHINPVNPDNHSNPVQDK